MTRRSRCAVTGSGDAQLQLCGTAFTSLIAHAWNPWADAFGTDCTGALSTLGTWLLLAHAGATAGAVGTRYATQHPCLPAPSPSSVRATRRRTTTRATTRCLPTPARPWAVVPRRRTRPRPPPTRPWTTTPPPRWPSMASRAPTAGRLPTPSAGRATSSSSSRAGGGLNRGHADARHHAQ